MGEYEARKRPPRRVRRATHTKKSPVKPGISLRWQQTTEPKIMQQSGLEVKIYTGSYAPMSREHGPRSDSVCVVAPAVLHMTTLLPQPAGGFLIVGSFNGLVTLRG
jgi:hypothetical protein